MEKHTYIVFAASWNGVGQRVSQVQGMVEATDSLTAMNEVVLRCEREKAVFRHTVRLLVNCSEAVQREARRAGTFAAGH